MSTDNEKPGQRPVNPIVAKAAAQVRKSKSKDRRRQLSDAPCWDCPEQLSLFAPEETS
ncbi:hypothetical protein [Nocardia wallacei]|uniref:hypothetical protein n=1 Tax=Nocardia wallacei TaxID=480035 RepID=UPI00245482B0|nr:hypothetical protein [Nocardia wallacei]